MGNERPWARRWREGRAVGEGGVSGAARALCIGPTLVTTGPATAHSCWSAWLTILGVGGLTHLTEHEKCLLLMTHIYYQDLEVVDSLIGRQMQVNTILENPAFTSRRTTGLDLGKQAEHKGRADREMSPWHFMAGDIQDSLPLSSSAKFCQVLLGH